MFGDDCTPIKYFLREASNFSFLKSDDVSATVKFIHSKRNIFEGPNLKKITQVSFLKAITYVRLTTLLGVLGCTTPCFVVHAKKGCFNPCKKFQPQDLLLEVNDQI